MNIHVSDKLEVSLKIDGSIIRYIYLPGDVNTRQAIQIYDCSDVVGTSYFHQIKSMIKSALNNTKIYSGAISTTELELKLYALAERLYSIEF